MTRWVPKDRTKAEFANGWLIRDNEYDDLHNFVRIKAREKTPKSKHLIFDQNFRRVQDEVLARGTKPLSQACELQKCQVGRTKPGILGWSTDPDPAICVRLEVDHPSQPGACEMCSGPYYTIKRRDWKWQNKERLEHEPPERGCPYNIFEYDDTKWEDIATMVFDELVEKDPDYKERDWE